MSFGLGHVVVLLIVIALVVPTLLQMCDAPGSQSCARSTRSSTPPQWAAPGRSSPPLPGGLEADHPVLFLSRHILGHSARDACSSSRISREHLSRRPRGCPFLTDPVRLGTKEELGRSRRECC